MAAVAAEEALPRGNALRRGGDASSTSVVAATATFKWSSQNTSLVICWEGSAHCVLHHNQTGGTFDLSKDSERAGTVPLNISEMNQSSCNITADENFPLVQLCVYIPVLLLGVLLNVLALWVFCCKLGKWTETRVYMVNLAVADCLLLFTLPFKTLSQSQQMKADRWCLILEGGYFINRLMSIGIITVVAADRYVAIKYPLKAKALRSPLRAAFASGFLWIVIICVISLIKTMENREHNEFCFEKSSVEPSVITLCAIIGGFFIPLIVVIYCSTQVIAELMGKKNENCHEERLIRKAVYIVTANMAVFIVCFLPVYTGHLLRFLMDSFSSSCPAIQKVNNFVHLASVLANTNCCLDAICYYFVNKEFQEASPKLARSKSDSGETAEVQLPGITRQCQMERSLFLCESDGGKDLDMKISPHSDNHSSSDADATI